MNRLKWSFLICLLILTTSHAETIVQTQNFSGVPNLNAVLTFNKFNPALGTLTGVNVELQLSTSGGQCGVDNDGALGGLTNIQFGTEGKLTSAMPLVNASWQSILQQVRAYTEGNYTIAADNGDGINNYDPTPPDWALHSGSSDTQTEDDDINTSAIGAYNGTDTYTITAGIKTYYDFTGIGGADVLSSAPSTSGYVKVTYIYNPYVTDIGVTKNVDSNNHYYGDLFPFTIIAVNNGPDPATGVQIQDNLPAGLTLMSSSATKGSYSSGIWTIGNMSNSESQTLTLNVRANATGTFNNTASLYYVVQQDNNPGNNSDSETVTVPSESDLSLNKTVNNPTPNVGSNIIYTLTLNNAGPNTATNVTVDDDLPAGLSYQSHTISTGTYNSGTGTWSIPSMPVGNATLAITVRVTASGARTNHAQVTASTQRDPDSTPNNMPTDEDDDDDATITVPPSADLRISKTATALTPPNVDLDENVRFDITLTNDGPDVAHNVTAQDLLDSDFIYVSSVPSGTTTYNSGTGTWTVGTLNVGASVTLQITVTANATGSIPNKARVMTSDENDPDSTPGNDIESEDDQETVTVVVPSIVDLQLTKVVQTAPSPLRLGNNVTFRITVTNQGPDQATGVHVSDLVPAADFTYVTNTRSQGTYNSITGDWNVGTLNNGASATIDITATVLKTTAITNRAQVSACNQQDSDSTPNNWPTDEDDDGFATVDPDPAADLRISKTATALSPPNVDLSENIRFDITLTNDGPDIAHNVTAEDILDSDFTYVSSVPSGTTTYNSGTGTWTVGTLNVGASATLQITATVNATGNIPNKVRVMTSDEYDPDSTPGNDVPTEDDQDDVTVTVPRIVDLELSKVVQTSPSPLRLNDNVTFRITVSNDGPDQATGVHVSDLVPAADFTYVTNTRSQGTYSSTTGDWNVGTLNNGASATIDITATVLKTTAIINRAQVSACDGNDIDSTPNNWPTDEDDDGFATVDPDPAADLRISKTATALTPPNVDLGENVRFDLTLTNDGPDIAHNVTAEDILDSDFTYVSSVPSGTTTYNSGTGTWTVGTLAVGASVTLQITATVEATGTIPNKTRVMTSDEYDPDSTPGNDIESEDDQETINVSVPLRADLELSKTIQSAPSPLNLFDEVTFRITVANQGPDDATGVHVRDLLPAGDFTYVSNLPSQGSYNSSSGDWNVGSLNDGASATIDITATVLRTLPVTNRAQVSACDQLDIDSTPDNWPVDEDDDGYATVDANPAADLSLQKDVSPGTTYIGGNATFTITLTNNGPDQATNVTVEDVLPAGLTYVSSSTLKGSFDNGTCIWTAGTLNNGESAVLQIIATTTVLGSITNTAQVHASDLFDPDSEPDNDDDGEDDQDDATVNVSPVADLRLEKTVNIPTPDIRGTVIYTITVTNEGPSNATGVVVEDVLESPRVVYLSHTGGTYDETSGLWTIGALANGNSAALQITARVDSAGATDNIAQVHAANEYDDDSTPDNDDADEDDQDNALVVATSATIGDYVWNDANGDKNQDASETGMAGVTVNLIYNGTPLASDVTDAAGLYIFENLRSGNYRVEVDKTTVPYNYASTTNNTPFNLILNPGEVHLDADFGYKIGQGSIGELVWHDMNANAVQDPGEPGLNNVTVILKNRKGNVIQTMPTNEQGWYRFYNLPPSTYFVEVDESTLPENFTLTTGVVQYNISLKLDEKYSLANFGYRILNSSIGDFVWNDRDAGKDQETGEPGIAGVTVRLSQGGLVIDQKVTDANGKYLFSKLAPGEYTVDVDTATIPEGFARTTDHASFTVTMNGVDAFLDADFGYRIIAGTIGDYVWKDENGDAVQDASEPGIAGVTVQLKQGDTVIATETTDETGHYLFASVLPGVYTVDVAEATILEGMDLTTANDPHTVDLAPFEDHLTSDFGYRSFRGKIGDRVWFDEDGQADQDITEPGISGVVVQLKKNGAVTAKDTTDTNGLYLFDELLPGEYTVDVNETTLPFGYKLTTANEPDAVTLEPYEIHLISDFGYKASVGSIGDYVWHDQNRDGIQDLNEKGIPDISLVLLDSIGHVLERDTTDAQGKYLFDKLPEGSYKVDVHSMDPDMPDFFFSTTDNEPLTVDLGEAEVYMEADFGYATLETGLGVIGDYAWHDSNWDRNQDPNEEQLSRVFVSLYLNGVFVEMKETDPFGIYHFYNLVAGEYDVIVDVYGPKPAFLNTVSRNPRIESLPGVKVKTEEWTLTTIDSFHVSLAEGEIYLRADFGFAFPSEAISGSIGDFVWLDKDEDGEQDAGEPGIAGVTVNLYKNNTVQSDITDANGQYLFENLFPGEYTVDVDESTMPDEYKLSSAHETYELFIAGGMAYRDADFGYRKVRSWQDGRRYVIARYQPWYADAVSDSASRHWKPEYQGGYSDTPVIGEYDTYENESLWEYHILSAWGSGIDGFAVDWYGRSSFENTGLLGLLDKAEELNIRYKDQGFRFEIMVSYNETAQNSVEENLNFIANPVMLHEAYWGNKQGTSRPLFVYDTEKNTLNAMNFRAAADTLLPEDAIVLWNEFDLSLFDPADVCYSWVQPLDRAYDPDGKVWGETYLYTSYQVVNSSLASGKLLFALGTVWPGYDDREWSSGHDRWIDRQDTLVYQFTWDLVHAYNLPLPMPWCLVETWNNWNQGTGIEPTVEYAYDFTRMTRLNAAKFKGLSLNQVGIDDQGMLALRHIYQARMKAAASLSKPAEIQALIQQALDSFFAGDFLAAISHSDEATGIAPPQISIYAVADSSAAISWPSVSENHSYRIYISTDSTAFENAASLPAPLDAGHTVEYLFTGLEPETHYYVAISVTDEALGPFSAPGWVINSDTGTGVLMIVTAGIPNDVEKTGGLPDSYNLSQNYPNPFNPSTTIEYALPIESDVLIEVFDVRGRLICTLVNHRVNAGYHQEIWNGTDEKGAQVSSGSYIIKMTSGKVLTRKVMFLK